MASWSKRKLSPASLIRRREKSWEISQGYVDITCGNECILLVLVVDESIKIF